MGTMLFYNFVPFGGAFFMVPIQVLDNFITESKQYHAMLLDLYKVNGKSVSRWQIPFIWISRVFSWMRHKLPGSEKRIQKILSIFEQAFKQPFWRLRMIMRLRSMNEKISLSLSRKRSGLEETVRRRLERLSAEITFL